MLHAFIGADFCFWVLGELGGEGSGEGANAPSPADYGVWGSVVNSSAGFGVESRLPTNFLSFGASTTPLRRLESSYWPYSRSGKKWHTLKNLQVAVMLQKGGGLIWEGDVR